MAKTIMLQDNFKLGERSDYPLDQMPLAAVALAQNWIVDQTYGPTYGTPIRARAGFSEASSALASYSVSTARYPQALGWWPGLSYPLWCADEDGYVTKINSSGSISAQGSTSMTAMSQNPVVFSERIVFFQEGLYPFHFSGVGTSGSLSIYGIPAATVGVAAFGKLFVAATSDKPARVYFNKTPSVSTDHPITQWDTGEPGGLWVDSTQKVTALAAVNNAVLVFSGGSVERLRGTYFDYGDSTVEMKPLFAEGVASPKSVVTGGGFTYFANANSLWRTDGGTVVDFAAELGIRRRLSGLSTAPILGLWRDYLFVSTGTQNGSLSPTYVINLVTGSVVRFTNIRASAMVGSDDATDELYFGHKYDVLTNPQCDRVYRMSTCFTSATSANVYDAADEFGDGQTTLLLTGYRRFGGFGKKRFRRAYVTYSSESRGNALYAEPYYLADGSDVPATATNALETGVNVERSRFNMSRVAPGVGFYFTSDPNNTGASTAVAAEIHGIEIEAQPQEQSRIG